MQDSMFKYKTQLDELGKCGFQFVVYSQPIIQLSYFLTNHLLAKYQQEFLVTTVMQLIRECIMNGVKANAKRAWMSENDITNEMVDNDPDVLERF